MTPAVVGGLAALALVWGTQFVVIRAGLQTVPPMLSLALRFLLVAAVGHAAARLLRACPPAGAGATRIAFAGAQAAAFTLLYAAQARLPAAIAGLLFTTQPLFVALMAHGAVPGERLTPRRVAALAAGFAGVALVTLGPGDAVGPAGLGGHGAALAAVLLGAAAGAANKVLAKRLTSDVPAPILLRDLGLGVGGAALAVWLAAERDLAVRFTPTAVAAALWLALAASAGATALYLVLLGRLAVSALAYLQFVVAVVAVGAGVLIDGDALATPVLAGAALVALGLALLTAGGRTRGPRPPP